MTDINVDSSRRTTVPQMLLAPSVGHSNSMGGST